jgi:5'(3')-deoxyribonucleotidase
MKISDLLEDGRIVKGVNTTPDVGPNEITKQAKKFGNTVDKDGRPPTLSKKVKGKSTNVLFNLGLAESKMSKELYKQLKMGIEVEMEHTDNPKLAMKIAIDHIKEDPKYYDKLKFIHDEQVEEKWSAKYKRSINCSNPKGFSQKAHCAGRNKNEAQELSSVSTIYVDMDGVLADFFGAWAKLMKKDHWTKIDDIMPALQKIRDTENFWLDLPLTVNAKNLLMLIKDVKGEYNILSSPLPDDPNSEPHKREWIKKNLNFFPPKDIIITHDKAKYATTEDGTPNILIDDYGVNIQKWEAAGGVGFKHKDHKFERTAKNIKQHMQEPVESYTREQLPQLRQKNLKNIRHTMEWVRVEDLIPVQEERILENFKRQVDRIVAGKYNPIIVDCDNKIVNGHHRYEAAKLMGYDEMAVAKLPFTIQQIVENFADGKKKGKSRPGRVKRAGASCKGSVTSLRKKAKNASGERAKMYHWCANMKSGRNK